MTDYTPGPLRLERHEDRIILRSGEQHVASVYPEPEGFTVEDVATADRLALAYNVHDELVEALTKARDAMNGDRPEARARACFTIDALLARIRGA